MGSEPGTEGKRRRRGKGSRAEGVDETSAEGKRKPWGSSEKAEENKGWSRMGEGNRSKASAVRLAAEGGARKLAQTKSGRKKSRTQ